MHCDSVLACGAICGSKVVYAVMTSNANVLCAAAAGCMMLNATFRVQLGSNVGRLGVPWFAITRPTIREVHVPGWPGDVVQTSQTVNSDPVAQWSNV